MLQLYIYTVIIVTIYKLGLFFHIMQWGKQVPTLLLVFLF